MVARLDLHLCRRADTDLRVPSSTKAICFDSTEALGVARRPYGRRGPSGHVDQCVGRGFPLASPLDEVYCLGPEHPPASVSSSTLRSGRPPGRARRSSASTGTTRTRSSLLEGFACQLRHDPRRQKRPVVPGPSHPGVLEAESLQDLVGAVGRAVVHDEHPVDPRRQVIQDVERDYVRLVADHGYAVHQHGYQPKSTSRDSRNLRPLVPTAAAGATRERTPRYLPDARKTFALEHVKVALSDGIITE